MSIIICDGAVDVVEHFDRNWNNGLLDQADIKLTAKEAAELAKKLGMRGGNPENPEDWAYGYHFKMSYDALAVTPEDRRIFLEVIGVSPDGNFAHIDFDAVTGELLLAVEEIEHENGETEWRGWGD